MLEIPTFSVLENAIDRLLNEFPVIGMNSFHRRFRGRFELSTVVFKDPEGFVRPKKLIPRQVPAKTPGMAESLSFGQVSLASPQLDRHLFLIGDVHRRADELGHHSVFENSSTYAPDVAQLAAGSDDPVFVIAAATFGRHFLEQCGGFCAIFGMDMGEIAVESERFCAIESENPVSLIRKEVEHATRVIRPASRVRQ